MDREAPLNAAVIAYPSLTEARRWPLLRELLVLALPVFAEQVLHMLVGLNDTYLANHVVRLTPGMTAGDVEAAHVRMTAAAAAVGTVSYCLWFVGLITGAVGSGATAIIARATGAKHRRLANSICGQAISAAVIVGVTLWAVMYFFARPLSVMTGLTGQGQAFALSYFKMLSVSLPFLTLMFIANACLRGAGDTVTPAVTFIIVDIVNMFFSFGLTYGLWGLPAWGFEGIAAGTVIAYIAGGVIQAIVLLRGRGGIRLYVHRLAPHWHNLRRLLRIGLPAGFADAIQWIANFARVIVINQMDKSLVSSAAHNNTIKIESLSYLGGFAFATAAATMVGQSLGMRDPKRAERCAFLGYLVGGGMMTLMGIVFILFGKYLANFIASDDSKVADLTARCLFITGFCQSGFASAMIFGGALRGAGDTYFQMILNLSSIVVLRFGGVMLVTLVFHRGLTIVWIVLACELFIRGMLMFGRFSHGGWKHIQV
jgi:putative MATE family efflux protein